jgi:hypothetical protein
MAQKSQHWNNSKAYAGEGALLVSIKHCAPLELLTVVQTQSALMAGTLNFSNYNSFLGFLLAVVVSCY